MLEGQLLPESILGLSVAVYFEMSDIVLCPKGKK
jgi:hypothetical protein